MKNKTVRLCKHCKSEMPAGAKVCPTCRRKQGGKLKYVVIVIAVILVLGAIAGGNDDSSSGPSTQKTAGDNKTQKEQKITYKSVTASQLEEDLTNNALSASDQYQDQYLEISGFLSNIDSDGAYISLDGGKDDFNLISILCYIKDDSQLAKVKTLSKGQALTIRGRCKDVGEVLGYSIDITDIK